MRDLLYVTLREWILHLLELFVANKIGGRVEAVMRSATPLTGLWNVISPTLPATRSDIWCPVAMISPLAENKYHHYWTPGPGFSKVWPWVKAWLWGQLPWVTYFLTWALTLRSNFDPESKLQKSGPRWYCAFSMLVAILITFYFILWRAGVRALVDAIKMNNQWRLCASSADLRSSGLILPKPHCNNYYQVLLRSPWNKGTHIDSNIETPINKKCNLSLFSCAPSIKKKYKVNYLHSENALKAVSYAAR